MTWLSPIDDGAIPDRVFSRQRMPNELACPNGQLALSCGRASADRFWSTLRFANTLCVR